MEVVSPDLLLPTLAHDQVMVCCSPCERSPSQPPPHSLRGSAGFPSEAESTRGKGVESYCSGPQLAIPNKLNRSCLPSGALAQIHKVEIVRAEDASEEEARRERFASREVSRSSPS